MIFTFIYIVISLLAFFLGIFQIAGKNRRGTLNWNFFAICTVVAISTFNTDVSFYKAFSENARLGESSYIFSTTNIVFSTIKVMAVPFLFAFILNLSKINSKKIKYYNLFYSPPIR